jgi:hypothetical protein
MSNTLETLTILNNQQIPCTEGAMCSNSPINSLYPRCNECRLSPNLLLSAPRHYWKPRFRNAKHPILEKEKQDAKHGKAIAKREAEKAKDPTKQARAREAARAERKTNAQIIKSTRNSGRVNKDGDHILFERITLDTKLQSKTEHPVVNLHELDKVRRDAKNANQLVGGLLIRNKNGRGVLVIDEEDIGKLY